MTYRVFFNRRFSSKARIISSSYTIIMFIQMKTKMQCGKHTNRLIEYLNHARIINLMYNYIEIEAIRQCVHFHLSSPDTILTHITAILFNCFIIFYKWKVHLFILKNIFNCLSSVGSMQRLITVYLILSLIHI